MSLALYISQSQCPHQPWRKNDNLWVIFLEVVVKRLPVRTWLSPQSGDSQVQFLYTTKIYSSNGIKFLDLWIMHHESTNEIHFGFVQSVVIVAAHSIVIRWTIDRNADSIHYGPHWLLLPYQQTFMTLLLIYKCLSAWHHLISSMKANRFC